MSLKPIGDLIVVKPDPKEEMIGRFILADSAQEEAKYGTVIAAGPGKQHEHWFEKQEIQVGQRVLFSKYAKETFKWQGQELLTMHPADLVGLIDE